MLTYVVISSRGSLDDEVKQLFTDQDRCQASPDVWFVRSERVTSKEVAQDLGIKAGDRTGIVVKADHYSGIADRGVVEKISVWENEP